MNKIELIDYIDTSNKTPLTSYVGHIFIINNDLHMFVKSENWSNMNLFNFINLKNGSYVFASTAISDNELYIDKMNLINTIHDIFTRNLKKKFDIEYIGHCKLQLAKINEGR